MSKDIGIKIRQLRKSRTLTQDQLAEKIDISRSTISNYEIGRRTPHLRDLQRFAAFFGVGLDYFGISAKDEAFDLLARAQEVFQCDDVPNSTKEELYHEFMKLYLSMKEGNK